MKKTVPVALIAAFCSLAHAKNLTIDLSGYQFYDEQGAAVNTVLEIMVGSGINITQVSWDVNLTTLTEPTTNFQSWASGAILTLDGQEDVTFAPGINEGVNNRNFTGTQHSNITIGADGLLHLEFWERYVDITGLPDAQFEAGSTLTLHTDWIGCPTPSPLAALGIGALIVSRRQRPTSSKSSGQSIV